MSCHYSGRTVVPHRISLFEFDNYHMLAERGETFCDGQVGYLDCSNAGFDSVARTLSRVRDQRQVIEDVKIGCIGVEEMADDLILFLE